MKVICLILFASIFSFQSASAQQSHFLFIQSENRQPFNVTLNNKVFSSTATGYVIIPKLASGQYNIVIGFGGNSVPDQSFTIQIDQKDVGFSLKDFSDKGWALYNLQTMDVTYAGQSTTRTENTAASGSATPPAKVFQPIVGEPGSHKPASPVSADTTPTVTSNPSSSTTPASTMPQTKTAAEEPPVAVSNVSTGTNTNASQGNSGKQPVRTAMQSSISKISEVKGGEAYYITYVDGSQSDTISVLIPYLKIEDNTVATSGNSPEAKADSIGLKFLNIETAPGSSAKAVDVPPAAKTNSSTPIVAMACNKVATQDDFLRLRKKMAAAPDNDAMLSEAKKYFKTTCFATSQVKDLAYLFLTDEARYHFFDTAYPFVTDKEQFPQLSIMLTNGYFLNRFKAMLIN